MDVSFPGGGWSRWQVEDGSGALESSGRGDDLNPVKPSACPEIQSWAL